MTTLEHRLRTELTATPDIRLRAPRGTADCGAHLHIPPAANRSFTAHADP